MRNTRFRRHALATLALLVALPEIVAAQSALRFPVPVGPANNPVIVTFYVAAPPAAAPPAPRRQVDDVNFTYDALGRLRYATYLNGTEIRWDLDAAGNRQHVNTCVTPPC